MNILLLLLLPCSLMACEPEYPWPMSIEQIDAITFSWVSLTDEDPPVDCAIFARDKNDSVWVGHYRDKKFYPILEKFEWPSRSVAICYWSRIRHLNK